MRQAFCANYLLSALLISISSCLSFAPAVAQDSTYSRELRDGRSAYQAGNIDEAEKRFRSALPLAATSAQRATIFYSLGVVMQKKNRLAEAKRLAEQALAQVPDHAQAKGLLGELAGNVVPAAATANPGTTIKQPVPARPPTAKSGNPGQAGAATPAAKAAAPPQAAPVMAGAALPKGRTFRRRLRRR